jgi:hypothetical protein
MEGKLTIIKLCRLSISFPFFTGALQWQRVLLVFVRRDIERDSCLRSYFLSCLRLLLIWSGLQLAVTMVMKGTF